MEVVNMLIDEVIPYENNPRINDDAVKYVAESINKFGFKVPIVIDKDNVIITGHTRHRASIELGLKKVPVIVADDLTDEQVKAYRLADNKVSEFSEWDFNALALELSEIDIDMELLGFESDEISIDDFGDDFELPSGEKGLGQITFTLANEQIELINHVLDTAEIPLVDTYGNTNVKGNKLYEVVRQWAEH